MFQPGLETIPLVCEGNAVERVVLANGTMRVSLLTLGAILQDVRLAGVPHALTLGTEDFDAYLGPLTYCGSLIGPVVNRISGASASLGDRAYRFEVNQDPAITLHSGSTGTQHRIWEIGEANDSSVVFETTLEDGLGGFPGNRKIAARFALVAERTLELHVAATSDSETWINFANHSFWNLDGSSDFRGHRLQVNADRFCVSDGQGMVTGQTAAMSGSDLDFHSGRVLQPGDDPLIDHNFCLSDQRRAITDVLKLTGRSGVEMTLSTTEPGVQVYDAGTFGSASVTGHNGFPISPYSGLAIEAQFWPDAPNQPSFPSIRLSAGDCYEQITRWSFSVPD